MPPAGLVRSFDSAQPVATAAVLPLTFISGVFIPWQNIPHWLQQVSQVFPVRPLAMAVLDPYMAHGSSGAWSPESYAVLAAWAAAGTVVAVRRFGWSPRDLQGQDGGVVTQGGDVTRGGVVRPVSTWQNDPAMSTRPALPTILVVVT
jgi:hypothetical protein